MLPGRKHPGAAQTALNWGCGEEAWLNGEGRGNRQQLMQLFLVFSCQLLGGGFDITHCPRSEQKAQELLCFIFWE